MRLWTNLDALRNNLLYFVRWALLSVLIGLVVGIPGAVFRKGIDLATRNWNQHPWMLLLGPVTVILIRSGLAMLMIRVFHMGLWGAWIAMLSDQIMRTLLMYYRYSTGKWAHMALEHALEKEREHPKN